MPPLPSKAWKRQLPFRQDEGLFEDEFIEERRRALETFINKVAGESPIAAARRDLKHFASNVNAPPILFNVHSRSSTADGNVERNYN